jgi:outer membrane protein assembly factor BamB
VADGRVVTLGTNSTLTCYDAASGKVVWRKDDFKSNVPRFHTSSSPIVVDNLCIVQLGGESNGAIVAYELASGNEKWKWADDGTAYASPVLASIGGKKVIVAETSKHIVAIGVADGQRLWETGFAAQGGRAYNACTPIVDGQKIIFSGAGRGTKAVAIEAMGDKLDAKDLWSNPDNSVQFNTPVVKNELIFGISDRDKLFCLSAETGKTEWTSEIKGTRGYGSIVDAGPALLAITPKSDLIVFEPNGKEFKRIANYKVAESDVYAYPVVSGRRIFIKDRDSVTLWTIP